MLLLLVVPVAGVVVDYVFVDDGDCAGAFAVAGSVTYLLLVSFRSVDFVDDAVIDVLVECYCCRQCCCCCRKCSC